MLFFLYLLISNSLMNKLDNGNRQKKSSACVSLTIFCLSFNKQANYWDMGVESRTFSSSGGTWFPLSMKLSNLRTLILVREECQGSADTALTFSTSSGRVLWTELLPMVSSGKLLQGWYSVNFLNHPSPPQKKKTFDHLLARLFFSCAANLQKWLVLVQGQIRSFGTRMLMVSHLDFFYC